MLRKQFISMKDPGHEFAGRTGDNDVGRRLVPAPIWHSQQNGKMKI